MSNSPTTYNKVLVSYLYFIQGVFLVIPSTTTLTYKQLPGYEILGFFAMATLPFSCKFISAPLVEKYTSSQYGRRKTWLVLSLILASLFIILASNFTAEDDTSQIYLCFALTAVIFMISIQDISTDALAVKELNSAELASYLQCVMQSFGNVVGSLLFLELVNGSLSQRIQFIPTITRGEYFWFIGCLIFLSAVIIHFTYKQKEQQKDQDQYTLLEVIMHYKHFVIPKFRLCRQAITFIIYGHGLLYFTSSYTVQLLKKNYISRDLLTSITNFSIIPVFFMTSILRKIWSDPERIHHRTKIILGIRLISMAIMFFLDLQTQLPICIAIILLQILSNAQFFIGSQIVNHFGQSRFSAMYVSMMGSFMNFGNNTTLPLQIIGIVGQKPAVLVGFGFTVLIFLSFGKIEKWIKSGALEKDMKSKQVKQN